MTAENLGTGVSYVIDPENYNYDTVVFQKGKPPLDTEMNLVQQLRNHLDKRQLATFPSGWLSFKPHQTSQLYKNSFYTQDPATAVPEYALVNGTIIKITNTNTTTTNANLVKLPDAPSASNQLNGVYLEVWRALLSPNSNTNKPDAIAKISALLDVFAADEGHAWACGEFGLILNTVNGGDTWNVQPINTKYDMNAIHFFNGMVGWVVGDNGTIAKTSSAGTVWTILTTSYTDNFNSVFSLSQSLAWVVGDGGIILKTTNGVAWLPLASGVSFNLHDIYFLNSYVGWAVGAGGTILKTVDGGSHWIKISSGTSENLNAVYFYEANTGFAVGDNGTILRSSDGGASWVSQKSNINNNNTYVSLASNYTDVTMAADLDIYVEGEEVSGQFDGTNNTFTVTHTPITNSKGRGAITNSVTDVTVKVDGVTVLVDSVNGTTGQILLHAIPATCATVKVTYWYKSDETFHGKVWVSGSVATLPSTTVDSGIILETDDLGQNWYVQNPNSVGYDINAVAFTSQYKGWLVAGSSFIRHTNHSGTNWDVQNPSVIFRKQERVFFEGNTGTISNYLDDDAIHPDANIETTKRVQLQYCIRTAKETDPVNYPESGLGNPSILGIGPNASGTYPFENMGPSTGDYGLWRARCLNTVDGYCYAIPMFFVNRRNTQPYNAATNSNGSSVFTLSSSIRPDLLTSNDVVDADILDVRRKVIIHAAEELLKDGMEGLLNGTLETRIVRDVNGGTDKYGTQILQVDRIGGLESAGGSPISATFSDAASGGMSSNVRMTPYPLTEAASLLQADTATHADVPLTPNSGIITSLGNGYIHPSPFRSASVYSNAGATYDRQPIPGDFTGYGTSTLTFKFKNYAINGSTDTNIIGYNKGYLVSTTYVTTDTTAALSYVPSDPRLVKNYNGDTAQQEAVYYHGVFEQETSGRIIEEWDSGITGKTNYAKAFPGADSSTATSITQASTVELHYFVQATSSNLSSNGSVLSISSTSLGKDSTSIYSVMNVTKVNNATAGFSVKIKNVSIVDPISVTAVSGYEYQLGSIYEFVFHVKASKKDTVFRSGSTVNFRQYEKILKTFCVSDVLTGSNLSISQTGDGVTLNTSNGALGVATGSIIGVSSTERLPITDPDTLLPETGLIHPVCWIKEGASAAAPYVMYPIIITHYGNSIQFKIYKEDGSRYASPPSNSTVKIQVIIRQNTLLYSNAGNNDGALIGYYYRPYQCMSDLPTSMTLKMLTKPADIMVSDLGLGGSFYEKDPYDLPLINIPVNDFNFTSDNQFFNIEPMRFVSFSVDGGFAKMPAYSSGNFDGDITVSTPAEDKMTRNFYSACSKEFTFSTEGLRIGSPRKIFIGAIGEVRSSTDNKFLVGEYVLVIFSRNAFMDTNNYTGYINGDKSVIAVYRLPNRPLIRG